MSPSTPENETLEAIREIFRTQLHVAVEDDDTDLIAAGLLDSLELVDLLLALEQRFGLEVRMDTIEFDDFRTIEKIAGWLERERRGTTPAVSSGE